MKTLVLSLMLVTPPAFAGNTRCMPQIMEQTIAAFDSANARGIVAQDKFGPINFKANMKVSAVEIRDLNKNAYAIKFRLYAAPIETLETSVYDVDYATCTIRDLSQLENLSFKVIND